MLLTVSARLCIARTKVATRGHLGIVPSGIHPCFVLHAASCYAGRFPGSTASALAQCAAGTRLRNDIVHAFPFHQIRWNGNPGGIGGTRAVDSGSGPTDRAKWPCSIGPVASRRKLLILNSLWLAVRVEGHKANEFAHIRPPANPISHWLSQPCWGSTHGGQLARLGEFSGDSMLFGGHVGGHLALPLAVFIMNILVTYQAKHVLV